MLRLLIVAAVALTATAAFAQEAPPPTAPSPDAASTESPSQVEDAKPTTESATPQSAPESQSAEAVALKLALATLPPEADAEDRWERTAALAFYEARSNAPLWLSDAGLTAKATELMDEIGKASDFGLDASAFQLPERGPLSGDGRLAVELKLSLAALKYARHARGGRIMSPSKQLNSHLGRGPQIVDPKTVIEGLASAESPAAHLRGLHPQHPQFGLLREKYLALRDARKGSSEEAKRLLANMEQWRWMPPDMGDVHVFANVPEFMLRVVKNGDTIHSERIVAGEVGKQTSIFSRRLKHIVFRPKWRVPESIKVKELWPSLLRGGGLFYKYGLQLETKEGEPLNFRKIDWAKADIREYEVTQPPGPKSVLGYVKFSFPSQHTIYMHDTPDKYMFNARQRTLSHGCLRVRDPLKLATLILDADKGWDRGKIDELAKQGPLNNEIAIDGRIPIHITYFTAWVDDAGAVKTYSDVYGHERRIKLALDGKWDKIGKGRDHLAPIELDRADPARVAATAPRVKSNRPRAGKSQETAGDIIGDLIGGIF